MSQGFGVVVAEHPEGHAGFPPKLDLEVVIGGIADEENFVIKGV
jgi:hypothetical protein